MYPVSNDYLEVLKEPTHKMHMSGMIGNKSFTESDFSSLAISNQCADENQVSIGSVFTAELRMTLIHDLGIFWGSAKGVQITLTESLEIDEEGTTENVPVGIFWIDEVTETKEGLEVVAYDSMVKFDKDIRKGEVGVSNRTLPAMLADICGRCNVTLANDSFDAFPNRTGIFTLATDNDCETYRDLVSWIALSMASYATITRDGKLELRLWKAPTNHDDEIDARTRADDYQFYKFETYYTGLQATDTSRQVTHYYHVEPDTGLNYNIGTNPFFQTLKEDRFNAACQNILNALQTIQYTPFNITILPTMAYDLGDIIKFSGGAGANKKGCLMLYDYVFNYNISFGGLGQDPSLATAKSKTDKNLSGILKKTEEAKEYLYQFYNDSDITLNSQWQTIFSQRFGIVAKGHAIFQGEILCDDPSGSTVEVRYLLDGEEVNRYPIETWIEGEHILSLFYPIQTKENEMYQWIVQMRSDGAVTIDENNGLGTIRGQGLASTETWDGYIDISETYELLDTVDESELLTFTDSASVGTLTPISNSISESYGLLDSTDDSELVDYLDVYAFNKDFHNRLTWDESAEMNWDASEAFYVWGLDTE